MFCPSCGNEYHQKLNFCKGCGTNLNPHNNTVDVNVCKPPIASMTWATVLFGLIGGLISLILFVWSIIGDFGDKHYKEARVGIASFVSLLFTCMVILLLVRQLRSLITGFRETIRQTVKEERFENSVTTQPMLSQQPLFVSVAPEPPLSVTENTTRSFSPVSQTGDEQRNT